MAKKTPAVSENCDWHASHYVKVMLDQVFGGNLDFKMNYVERINSLLRPNPNGKIRTLDLFAGCGGLALGFEAQGFETLGFEQEADACETYRRNLKGDCRQITLTPETQFPKADVIIGGPPCQPFSVGGHQMGLTDSRDGFPIFISAVKQVQPEIWVFENVRGVLYSNRWYFEQILTALKALNYVIEVRLLNAVNFGVPQNRERVIVVGHRGEFQFFDEASNRVTAGMALGESMRQAPPESKFLTASMDEYVGRDERTSFCVLQRVVYPENPADRLACRVPNEPRAARRRNSSWWN